MSGTVLSVKIIVDSKTIQVPYTADKTTSEDICIYACKQLNIGNAARHLFALRRTGKQVFLIPSAVFKEKDSIHEFDLRIRFKASSFKRLKNVDIKAYDYFFHQARSDVLENRIPEIICDKYRRELVGLGITDMYRVMLEKDIPIETVENEYKKYIPKEVLKRHSFFIKRPIHDTLVKLKKSVLDPWYIKEEYLKQLEIIAPEYLSESYKAVCDDNGSIRDIHIKVTPFHPTEPGIKYTSESKKDIWKTLCTIEDLGFVSIKPDATVEISRKNGIPFYLKFSSISVTFSFISLLDGYYRLTCKWTFNICKDVQTPSLQKLYAMKCHGPVGGEFSYAKLEEKRSNKPGCFIIRESESKYNIYYIDVCMKDSNKPKTYKLEKIAENEFIFNDDVTRYKNVHQLMAAYNNPEGTIYLQECLPPSEYDSSPLLLCLNENVVSESLTDTSSLNNILPNSASCINCKDLQVYKGHRKEGTSGKTVMYRSMWRVTKGKKIEVALKVLKDESGDKYLKEFLTVAGQWAFLQSSAIVKLFGFVFTGNVSMVMEYFRLGPLDHYLREKKSILKPVDLIEASSNLATALWHLKENGIVHGNIRCRKLMVSTHDENSFTVKLADPGIVCSYSQKEFHWIPVEYYGNLNFSRRSAAADVWACATTIWEIFMFGKEMEPIFHIEDMINKYTSGARLPQPPNCPNDIYQVMKECWDADPYRRKQPQAIMRDINQLLYQLYNSRKNHAYAKVSSSKDQLSCLEDSKSNLYESTTDITYASYTESMVSLSQQELHNWWESFSLPTDTTSLDSITTMQSVLELDDDCNVVLQGRIGQGFYGEVYRGTLEYLDREDTEPRKVAVKKLKPSALSSCLQDFEREIDIMKSLKHPNIVEILGVLREPEIALVMEFVQHGSLQSYLKIYRESLQAKQLLKYAHDVAQGMMYLGQKNIVHRDLAARNILVVDENHVKISDFGLAQVIDANDYYILKTNRELPIKWYAPESLRDGKFSVRSDVWSYGVTMCEMFSFGEEPQLANMDKNVGQEKPDVLLTHLENGARFPCPAMCPQSVYIRIIYPCWEQNPHCRPQFAQLILEIDDLLTQH